MNKIDVCIIHLLILCRKMTTLTICKHLCHTDGAEIPEIQCQFDWNGDEKCEIPVKCCWKDVDIVEVLLELCESVVLVLVVSEVHIKRLLKRSPDKTPLLLATHHHWVLFHPLQEARCLDACFQILSESNQIWIQTLWKWSWNMQIVACVLEKWMKWETKKKWMHREDSLDRSLDSEFQKREQADHDQNRCPVWCSLWGWWEKADCWRETSSSTVQAAQRVLVGMSVSLEISLWIQVISICDLSEKSNLMLREEKRWRARLTLSEYGMSTTELKASSFSSWSALVSSWQSFWRTAWNLIMWKWNKQGAANLDKSNHVIQSASSELGEEDNQLPNYPGRIWVFKEGNPGPSSLKTNSKVRKHCQSKNDKRWS